MPLASDLFNNPRNLLYSVFLTFMYSVCQLFHILLRIFFINFTYINLSRYFQPLGYYDLKHVLH